MSEPNGEGLPSSGLGFLAYMSISLVALIVVVAACALMRHPKGSAPMEPLPSVAHEYAPVTPVPLDHADQPILNLDSDPAMAASEAPGYVYALARLASLAGRPTRVWEAAVLSRMAFEFHYSPRNPLLSDLFIDRAVTLFARNAGLEIDHFQSASTGPLTVDDAAAFLRSHLAAGRPVLFDHFEWGLFIGEERKNDRNYFVAIGSSLQRLSGSEEKWRAGNWWLRPYYEWVHNLVAVTHVYKDERGKAYEIERAAVAAAVIAAPSRLQADVADLPESYVSQVRALPAGQRSYQLLVQDLESGQLSDPPWLSGFPVQRVRYARHAAAVYFQDATQYFEGELSSALQEAADAYRREATAWDEYIALGAKGDDNWRAEKAAQVKKAAAADQQAVSALETFYVKATTAKNRP